MVTETSVALTNWQYIGHMAAILKGSKIEHEFMDKL